MTIERNCHFLCFQVYNLDESFEIPILRVALIQAWIGTTLGNSNICLNDIDSAYVIHSSVLSIETHETIFAAKHEEKREKR